MKASPLCLCAGLREIFFSCLRTQSTLANGLAGNRSDALLRCRRAGYGRLHLFNRIQEVVLIILYKNCREENVNSNKKTL